MSWVWICHISEDVSTEGGKSERGGKEGEREGEKERDF